MTTPCYTVDGHGMGYVYLTGEPHPDAAETVSVGSRFQIDLDYRGRPIGVEIFSAQPDAIFADALIALATWFES